MPWPMPRPTRDLSRVVTGFHGKPRNPEQVATQVVRMLGETKLPKPRILGFFREYFEYGGAMDDQGRLQPQSMHEVLVSDTDPTIMHFYEQDKHVLRNYSPQTELVNCHRLQNQETNPNAGQKLGSPSRPQPAADGVDSRATGYPAGSQRAGIPTQPAWLVAKTVRQRRNSTRPSGYEENSLAALSPTCRSPWFSSPMTRHSPSARK